MKEREQLRRQKTGTSTNTNSSLVSPHGRADASPTQNISPPLYSHDISKISLRPQTRLSISQPGDADEQEADLVAQEVMRMSYPESIDIQTSSAENYLASKIIQPDGSLDLPEVPNYQLTLPFSSPNPTSRYRLGGDFQLQLDPEIQAMVAQFTQQQLQPTTIRPNLTQVNLGLPATIPATAPTPSPFTLPTIPPPTTLVPAGAGPDTPREANLGDFTGALMSVPAIDNALTSLQTQIGNQITQDWSRLRLGEQIGVVSSLALIGSGTLAGIISDPTARQFALSQLNGRILPVPGLNWLHLEMNTESDALMLGLHVDVGRLLPPSWGFGSGSISPIGGVPQPEPFIPGSLGISRQEIQRKCAECTREDIYLGSGQLPGNNELIARELTHVIQQTGGIQTKKLNPTIQRNCDPSVSSCLPTDATASGSATRGLPPEAARQLLYATTTLRHVEPLTSGDRGTLERVVPGAQIVGFIQERDEKRNRLNQKTEEMQRYQRDIANPPEHGVPPNQEMVTTLANEINDLTTEVERLNRLIQAALPALGISSEQQLARLVSEDFPRMFIERGKKIALAELNQNKTIVEQEVQRYGLNACVDPAERQGLVQAARDLINRDREIEELQQSIQTIRSSIEPLPGGVPDPASMGSSQYDYQRQQERLQQLQLERNQRQQGYRVQYPIMLQENLDLRAIASGSEEQINNAIGGRLQEILSNIEDTKANINSGRLKIWNLRNIVDMTNQDLGIGSNQILQATVNEYIQREQSDERILQIGLAALAITAGLVATFATGGLAIAAGAVAIGVGTYQVSQSVQNYMAESAASNIALDPTVADISNNEPELLWLVLDIAGVIFDVAQVVRAVNQLRNAARALRQSGAIVEFAQAARGALPAAAAERVIASATRQAGVSASIGRTIEAVGTAFRRADMAEVARQLEQIAGKSFANIFDTLRGQGRVHPLTEEALEAIYGQERAAQMITGERMLTWRGFYDPSNGRIFIKPGQTESVTSTIVHEATHWLQDVHHGRNFPNFMAEFQAFSMEREFLRRLAFNAGEEAVPQNMRWLLNADDNVISSHITDLYGYTAPGIQDGEQAVQSVMSMARFFR